MDRRTMMKGAAAGAMGVWMTSGTAKAGETPKALRLHVRRASERGHVDHGWLKTWHTFSFASYHDPRHMGFRALRVINEDIVQPGRGFGMHPHKDMEIITYVMSGSLEHKDSMGNGSVIVPGEVQQMSAGSGVFHSEFNPSKKESVHLLQIWLLPDRDGVKPGYQQKPFSAADRSGRLRLVASKSGRDGSIAIHQDTNLYATTLKKGESVDHTIAKGRHLWLHVARGGLRVGELTLGHGDAVRTSDEGTLRFTATQDAEALFFDLA